MSLVRKSKNWMRSAFAKNSPIIRYYTYYHYKGRKDQAKRLIEKHFGNISQRKANKHLRMMRHAFIFEGWDFDEYFAYQYYRYSKEARKEFVTDTEKSIFCLNYNPREVINFFQNKGNTYKCLAEFYKRDVCIVKDSEQDMQPLKEFLEKHSKFIIKPIGASMGNGIQIVSDMSPEEVMGQLKEFPDGIIVEELIKQSKQMASLHESSVNTIRMSIFLTNGKKHLLYPFVKMGRGGSIVDNGAKGGLLGAIDTETGIVTSVMDENGKSYIVHPDTGMPLLGFQIPDWQEAINLAKHMIDYNPKCHYVGWDLAHTDQGWVLVEGNSCGQFVGFQLPTQKGIRQHLLSLAPKCLTFHGRP